MKRLILPTIAVMIILLGGFFVAGKLANHMHQNLKNLDVVQVDNGEKDAYSKIGKVNENFDITDEIDSKNGNMVNFYVKNNGEGTIRFAIAGYDEKTLLPGKEDFMQAEVKGKESFNFVISPEDDSPVSAEYRIVQRRK